MKVTVCFGAIRVVVPCGNGELLVRDLMRESIQRYKKASGKNPESWVVVHHLQSQSGILDPDDRVNDVADDREQILASYDDHPGPDPSVPQGGGDGASGSSSVGTGSPDIFRGGAEKKFITADENTPHIEVTDVTEPPPGLGLQVRRGSEPSLHQAVITEQRNQPFIKQQQDPTKRWSAAPVCRSDNEPPERILGPAGINPNAKYLSPAWNVPENDIEESHNEMSRSFTRSGRLSMQFLGDGAGYRWMDAADKVSNNNYNFNSKSLPREAKRKEPLGQAYESIREKDGEMLLIINERGGPLGLTAVPDSDNGGLLVQAVEPGSRAERGRLRRGDRILEINGTKLIGLSDNSVQDHLRQCLTAPELRVRVIRGSSILNKLRKDNKISELIEAAEKPLTTKVATVSPTRKVPGVNATGHHGTSLQVANTRRLGRLIEISLRKGPHGLGFSVTTRDNPAGGDCPIYIKNVLPRGAAIEDGRLKPGDRLLEVDGISMTGKTQTEVVGILRATQPGATVNIVVSRQHELNELDERQISYIAEHEQDQHNTPPKPPPPILPLKPTLKSSMRNTDHQAHSKITANTNDVMNFTVINESGGFDSISSSDTNHIFPWRNREVLTLHIPVHDTEKAGLGVSVKGKTGPANSGSSSGGSSSSSGSGINKHDGDLGIFIKSVLHGGAASRDGRLKMNDQLLSVNGVSLLGQNNAEAMETLRRAMLHTGGNFPGMITVTVARKISRSNSSGDSLEGDNSNTSEQSGATVIYLNSENNKQNINQFKIGSAIIGSSNNLCNNSNRWSNPVLDRLTGGTGNNAPNSNHLNRPSPLMTHGLRNDSYYIATNDNWSPPLLQNHQQPQHHQQQQLQHQQHQLHSNKLQLNSNLINNSVLIEEDPEPMSPTLPSRLSDVNSTISNTSNSTIIMNNSQQNTSTPITDATYASQLSLDTNASAEAFSRDAIGRRSMSEKHHAALDARETGTYQRNKKIREERERERKTNPKGQGAGSVESLSANRINLNQNTQDLSAEAMDLVGELGPSLGLKKSSSLESLQTMVQEIQMSDEPRGPNALRTPRGRGRDESLRAAVERPPESKPRKHWLLEDGISDAEGGFITTRNGPFQSSLNDGKHGKNRTKKPSLLKGIGHMFRFGKHRKDGVAPVETLNEFSIPVTTTTATAKQIDVVKQPHQIAQPQQQQQNERPMGGPPMYQPPPPPIVNGANNVINSSAQVPTSVNHDQIFNQRYSHYVNYEELQQQISSSNDLSESTIAQMRRQVMVQRGKVEEESRRYQHYHSQRSMRSSSSILLAQQQQLQNGNVQHEQHGHHLEHSQSHHSIQRNNINDQQQQQQPEHQQRNQRPISSYYEYETIQHNSQQRKLSAPTTPVKQQQWTNHSSNNNNNIKSQTNRMINMEGPTAKTATTTIMNGARNHGPFITQVTINEHQNSNNSHHGRSNSNNSSDIRGNLQPPASKV